MLKRKKTLTLLGIMLIGLGVVYNTYKVYGHESYNLLIDGRDDCEQTDLNQHIKNESGESSTTVHGLGTDSNRITTNSNGEYTGGTTIRIGDYEINPSDFNYFEFENPLVENSDGTWSTNNNYAPTGDLNFDIAQSNGDGTYSVTSDNPLTYYYFASLAKELGHEPQQSYSKDDINSLVAEAADKNVSVNITYEPCLYVKLANSYDTIKVDATYLKEHPDVAQQLLNDPKTKYAIQSMLKACLPAGTCDSILEPEHDCIDCPPEDDDTEDDFDDIDDIDDTDDVPPGCTNTPCDDDDVPTCVSNCTPEPYLVEFHESCSLGAPAPCSLAPEPTIPADISRDADCETNPTALYVTHDKSNIACGYADVLTTTTTTIYYPSKPQSPMTAGNSFMWGKASSTQNIDKSLFYTGRYDYTRCQIDHEAKAYQNYIDCLSAEIELIERTIDDIRSRIDTQCQIWIVGPECEQCTSSCKDSTCNCNSACQPHSTIDENCKISMLNNIDDLEDQIANIEKTIDSFNDALDDLSNQMAELEKCGAEITNYSGVNSTKNDVVEFSDPTMVIGSGPDMIKQNGNTIAGIEKNNGNLYTVDELLNVQGKYIALPGGMNTDKEHYFQFVVPIYARDGATAKLTIKSGNAQSTFTGNTYSTDASYPEGNSVDYKKYYNKYQTTLNDEERQTMQKLDPYEAKFYQLIVTKTDGEYALYDRFSEIFCGANSADFASKGSSALGIQSYAEWYLNETGSKPDMNYTITIGGKQIYPKSDEYCRDMFAHNMVDVLYEVKNYGGYSFRVIKAGKDNEDNAIGAKRFYDKYKNIIIAIINNYFKDQTFSISALTGSATQYLNGNGSLRGETLGGALMNDAYTATVPTQGVYTCNFTIRNPYICTSYTCDEDGRINLVYRQISLDNPFPNSGSESSRKMGQNWNEILANNLITNNRGVKTNEVYSLEPLYTIELTPQMISKIRTDYANTSLSDYNLICDADGLHCVSSFVHEYLDEIGAIDKENSCAYDTTHAEDWYDCYKEV